VDLDNTIISYDEIISQVALRSGFIGEEIAKCGKKIIRDTIRELPDGEVKWQRLQAEIYGPRISEARLIDGVRSFFTKCSRKSVPVYIISHKTQFASYDTTRTDLRKGALDWLNHHGFFRPNGIKFTRQHVFFCSTREEKIGWIEELSCTHFIDDLEETFLENTFPSSVIKILFDPYHLHKQRHNFQICNSWLEITNRVFGLRDE
jgi:hypothetical protein